MSAALPNPEFWTGKRVLLTGHTGFKGGWAALWLSNLGAEVTGLALPPKTTPSLFERAGIDQHLTSSITDLRDRAAVQSVVDQTAPQIVVHMAAQPLVRRSISEPVETIASNVLGTAHLLDALRQKQGLEAILVVTSDKVYANSEHDTAFREQDRLGGKDPYSASKASAELITKAFAQCYFEPANVPIATARAGNVIGGGDYSADRIVPDIIRAAEAGETLVLRHPEATRPWQHVLDCLTGYLLYAQALAERQHMPTALNFGPLPDAPVTVAALAEAMQAAVGQEPNWRHEPMPRSVETKTLAVDASQARALLQWRDRLADRASIAWTAAWYHAVHQGKDPKTVTLDQIKAYCELR